jgi:hypothetical protein
MAKYSARGIWVLALIVISTITLSFLPWYLNGLIKSTSGDDYNYYESQVVIGPFFRESAISCLAVAISPAADALLEVTDEIVTILFSIRKAQNDSTKNSDVLVKRMNHWERIIFVVASISMSLIVFAPRAEGMTANLLNMYNFIGNAVTPLMLLPTLSMLHRTTPSWTYSRILFVLVFGCFASICSSISYSFPVGSSTSVRFYSLSVACMCISAASYILMSFNSLLLFTRQHYRALTNWSREGLVGPQGLLRVNHPAYEYSVPAFHIVAGIILSTLDIAWYQNTEYTEMTLVTYNIVMLSAIVMIFVVEIRVRQNELHRILVCQPNFVGALFICHRGIS